MSWEPYSFVVLRCDGETTRGQCPALLFDKDALQLAFDPDGSHYSVPVLFSSPTDQIDELTLQYEGWILIKGRALCSEHVRAQEYLARAALEGLPFGD
ncbi:hypothetical protein ABT324_28100 [Saccharopolyspora sp. NPDC000359]|uniref:hypothetical protein n=1 Tax=Saccharopolyspora sp. NPDC000359 TaxID=3154251 RepID=UPI0033337623